jgi:hypothetical protein
VEYFDIMVGIVIEEEKGTIGVGSVSVMALFLFGVE